MKLWSLSADGAIANTSSMAASNRLAAGKRGVMVGIIILEIRLQGRNVNVEECRPPLALRVLSMR